ncbi:DUF6196 family protein [bacterium]|nr:DUF6196 family protein [bacterium]
MVQISYETLEEADIRLRGVIAEASFKIYKGAFAFEEFPLADINRFNKEALALVRDDQVWSQLVPSSDQEQELFFIFSFHFDGCNDNSGFVGWLASHLKQQLGTGVFVTCGQNSSRGGIFDYWGCPFKLKDRVLAEVSLLREHALL